MTSWNRSHLGLHRWMWHGFHGWPELANCKRWCFRWVLSIPFAPPHSHSTNNTNLDSFFHRFFVQLCGFITLYFLFGQTRLRCQLQFMWHRSQFLNNHPHEIQEFTMHAELLKYMQQTSFSRFRLWYCCRFGTPQWSPGSRTLWRASEHTKVDPTESSA